MTTSLIEHPTGPAFQIDLDLRERRLDAAADTGAWDRAALERSADG